MVHHGVKLVKKLNHNGYYIDDIKGLTNIKQEINELN